MANLRTDSPLSRRIVTAFIDFLSSVEPAPGVDREGLEVATECLSEVFRLGTRSVDEQVQPHLLIDLFTSAGVDPIRGQEPSKTSEGISEDLPVTTSSGHANNDGTSRSANEGFSVEPRSQEPGSISQDTLFRQFLEGLESAGFFANIAVGSPEYTEQLGNARNIFEDTMEEMKKAGTASGADHKVLAEAFKVQGNAAMAQKQYFEAIDLYTLAISLFGDSAVFYCNRAAAHTQVGKYMEAIEDCNKSIQIDPRYSKAYSRLGLVYYAQGKYHDAIQKGFLKALELDPNNSSIKENIRVANEKLEEELGRPEHGQSSGPGEHSTGSGTRATGPGMPSMGAGMHSAGFNTMPFNVSLPPEVANILPGIMNMAAQYGQNAHNGHPENGATQESWVRNENGQPEIRVDGNINLTFEGEEVPDQVAGFMHVMSQIFSGAHNQQGAAQGGTPRDPTSN
eukprot:Gb_01312 [translate_table: standard]